MAAKYDSVTTLLLSTSELRQLLDMKDVLKAVEEAFRLVGLGKVQMPPKMYLFFEKFNGDLRCMPSYVEDLALSAVKIVNVHMDNPEKHNLRSIMATILLIDPSSGAPIALLDGTHITDMRTGAASGVASKYLARKDSKTLGLIGTGFQARRQLQAILETFGSLELVRAFDRSRDASRRFIDKATESYGDRITSLEHVDNARDVVEEMDIVVTCTPSRLPIVKNDWVSAGQHFNCIGADAPGKHEIECEVMPRAKIAIDDWAQASHSGEINVPLSNGTICRESIYANIGDIVAGKKPGRTSDEEITLFCSTGLAIQDAITAKLAYDLAIERKVGTELKMIESY